MMRLMTLAILGAGGLLLGVPDADAQQCYRSTRRVRSYGQERYGYGYGHRYGSGFRVQLGYPGASFSYRRAPRHYSSRHCGRCRPIGERVWVNQPRYQNVFVGYDLCGRPVTRTVCVSSGHWATRTRYVCP